jgi:hypothetical protein
MIAAKKFYKNFFDVTPPFNNRQAGEFGHFEVKPNKFFEPRMPARSYQ